MFKPRVNNNGKPIRYCANPKCGAKLPSGAKASKKSTNPLSVYWYSKPARS